MVNSLALRVLKLCFSIYEMMIQMLQCMQTTILRPFNRKVVYVKYVSKTGASTHCFPMLGIKLMKRLKWDFASESDIYHLADVYFVIDSKIQRMMTKRCTLNAIKRKVKYEIDHEIIQKLKKLSTEYLMIECGGQEITPTYNDVCWSIKHFSAGDMKRLLKLPENEPIEVTGNDFCIVTKADHESL